MFQRLYDYLIKGWKFSYRTPDVENQFKRTDRMICISAHSTPFLDGILLHESLKHFGIYRHLIYVKGLFGFAPNWCKEITTPFFISNEIRILNSKDIDILERNSNGYFFDVKINRSHNFITNFKLFDDVNNKIKLCFITSSDCDNDTIIDKSTYIIPMLCSKSLISFRFYFDIKDKPEYITLVYDNYILTPQIIKYYSDSKFELWKSFCQMKE